MNSQSKIRTYVRLIPHIVSFHGCMVLAGQPYSLLCPATLNRNREHYAKSAHRQTRRKHLTDCHECFKLPVPLLFSATNFFIQNLK